MQRIIAATISVFLTMLVASPQEGEVPPSAAAVKSDRGIVIGPEDTVTIQARDAEEISKAWRVDTSGNLDLPMLGQIKAAERTASELERELAGRLRRYVREPQVTVWISEYRSQPVTITGAVGKAGTLQLQGPRTLFEVMIMAGGPREAGTTVTVTRSTERGPIPYRTARKESDGKYSVVDFDLNEVMNGRSAPANFEVRPYDLITVAPAQQKKLVHILGEVSKPGAIELVTQDTVSLMKVIAMAGGTKSQAATGKTMITHANSEGTTTETAIIDLKKIMNGKVKDLELSAGDIVVVPSSQLKAYLQMASVSAINMGVLVIGRI
jgi:polysaccharide export outer membrane protein